MEIRAKEIQPEIDRIEAERRSATPVVLPIDMNFIFERGIAYCELYDFKVHLPARCQRKEVIHSLAVMILAKK